MSPHIKQAGGGVIVSDVDGVSSNVRVNVTGGHVVVVVLVVMVGCNWWC